MTGDDSDSRGKMGRIGRGRRGDATGRSTGSGRDRGQAYTLESLVSAIVLVTAVLFALQSVVISPDSAGTLDRDVQAQLHQESSDLLVTAANEGELSQQVRYWDPDDGSFADQPGTNNSYQESLGGYQTDQLPVQDLGESLNHTVREGNQYNVIVAYESESGGEVVRNTTPLVFQGTPGDDVITASYTITLTDDMLVTGPHSGNTTLGEASDPPIPDRYPGSPVYNVVEVRLVLW